MEPVGYFPLVILAVLSAGVVLVILALGRLLTPPNPKGEKLQTYECGELSIGDVRKPIDIKYYIYVLIFLVLDVEVVFLVPWATAFRQLGLLATAEVLIFVAMLIVGWAYAWKEGLLRWQR